ncbi:SRPBCC domain-containing protein [Neogemmobacter tilapiae]|uniref:ATPase n=1 Tax=Neogemmobacter tilapiae TaxID=875041 RepID=A0A918WNK6_9RHOB|nr:SRPBCC domain-containing protein [Gemmobacter tilapiae]GHC61757.1 ATPase [Gemmobacter tilapiae]
MKLTMEGDTQILVTRRFAAPPAQVFRAHVEPALIKRWMTGPEGWAMPVCQNDCRTGGSFRFEWSDGKGADFHATGEYLTVEPNQRIVHVERMFLPDATPDNHVETLFQADGAGTLFTMRMTLPDGATREAMLATGMTDGMAESYDRLERVLGVG